ncbi:MAG: MerR family DNA-binding transcriptional regulator, partial [Candidatus Roizmanbacteria bacterium]|nr:MerR family DNA-binding transcriptional regulator [Candidatus Roizmanbacteria bacterium]
MKKKYTLSPREFATAVGVSASTVRRWERENVIGSVRNSSGYRLFSVSDIDVAKQHSNSLYKEKVSRGHHQLVTKEDADILGIAGTRIPLTKRHLVTFAIMSVLFALVGFGSNGLLRQRSSIQSKLFDTSRENQYVGSDSFSRRIWFAEVLAAQSDSLKKKILSNVAWEFRGSLENPTITVFGNSEFVGDINADGYNLNLGTGEITASNVIYSLTAGNGIEITGGQTPTISSTGVTSFEELTGDIDVVAGSNITITKSGNELTFNSSFTDTTYTAGTDLDLSGTEFSLEPILDTVTTINGLTELNLAGSFTYTDGNQAAGYVLSSDASGLATWTDVSSTAGPWTLVGSNLYPDDTSYNTALGATNAGTAKLYVNGNVGIGSTSPQALLTINGTTEQLRLEYDPTNYQSFTVNSAGSLFVAQNGSAATLALTNGSVGIGTTDPGAYKLNVNGNTNITGTLNVTSTVTGGTYNGLTLTSATDGYTLAGGTTPRTLTVTGSDITLTGGGNTLTLGGNVTTANSFTTSGAYALTLTQTGTTDVTLPTTGTLATLAGIESLSNKTLVSPIITTSPTAAGATWTDLGTVTTADINGGTVDGTVIGGASSAAATFTTITSVGTANINATGTSATNIGNSTGVLTLASGGASSWTNTSGDLTLQTATSGNILLNSIGNVGIGGTAPATSPYLFVGSTGNVGIGTTNPSSLFEVNGALKATTINGNTITTGTGVLTLGAGKTLTLSDSTTFATNAITLGGGEVITFSATNALSLLTTGTTSVTLPTEGTLYGTATDSITSAQLLASLSDETGTGLAVFNASPTITNPVIANIAPGADFTLTQNS